MATKWYGSVVNRMEEGQFFGEDKTIRVGTDITMYYYSDRTCYYVTEVVDQKHIFVKPYHVCADQSKDGGMGHQNWLYFKTAKEQQEYLNSVFHDREKVEVSEQEAEEWVFRYNSWNNVARWTLDKYNDVKKRDGFVRESFSEKEMEKLNAGQEVVKYHKINSKVSFGVKDFYYDWEF